LLFVHVRPANHAAITGVALCHKEFGDPRSENGCIYFLHCSNDPCLKARIIGAVKNIDAPMLTRVWQELEYRIDVCRVTRGAHIKHF
jgi:hypothetical protein